MANATYYRHARALGPFRAVDALRMARQAAALDVAARIALTHPRDVCTEVLPDGSGELRFSRMLRVY